MALKLNRKFIYVIGIVSVSLFVFAKCNHKSHPFINAYIEEHTDNWEKIKTEVIDTSNTVRVRLEFLNNPYKFSSKNNAAIYVDKSLVFKGRFESVINVFVPKNLFGDRTLPGLSIFDGGKAFHFIHKKSIFLNKVDKYLYIVFCPENELTESCFMFSQTEPIL